MTAPWRTSLIVLLMAVILMHVLKHPLHAMPGASPPSSDYESRVEKLQSAYSLFPLNDLIKRELAETYASRGFYLFKSRQYEEAEINFQKALDLYPDDANYLLLQGLTSYSLKKYDGARYVLSRLVELKPDSADGWYNLGLAQYDGGSRQDGLDSWLKALTLAPGRHDIAAAIDKARREMAVEADMDKRYSSRFDLTYDPGVSTTTARAILDVLESAANQVGSDLGHYPEARVPVAIYRRDDYKTVTASPDWSGGFYDGTIRLPFGTASEITPQLKAVIFHEYAHVVVYDLTRGNCPVWLNEGIAEIFGRSQFASDGRRSDTAMPSGVTINPRSLEGSFGSLSSGQALMAYQQSYSMVSYIVKTYGWHRVKEILAALGTGKNIETAIAMALKDYSLTYDGLIKEWRTSLGQSP